MRPEVKESQTVSSEFFSLRKDLLQNSSGKTHTYSFLQLPDAVSVLAHTPEGLWILNQEYRHPTGKTLLGPPGGRLDSGEDPLKGAQRELFEETGYWSDELVVLGSCHPFPGVCNQKIHYILAKNARLKGAQNLEPFEFVEVALKSDAELMQAVRNNPDVDGNLLTALLYHKILVV
jgi:ADP-ribose pyrophosphatase